MTCEIAYYDCFARDIMLYLRAKYRKFQLVTDKILMLCSIEEFAAIASSHVNRQLVIRLARPGKLVVVLQTEEQEFTFSDPADKNACLEFDDLALCICAAIAASGEDFIRFEVVDPVDIP